MQYTSGNLPAASGMHVYKKVDTVKVMKWCSLRNMFGNIKHILERISCNGTVACVEYIFKHNIL